MYLDNLLVMLKNPDDTWLERLRRGHFVWMAKENKFAKVEWAYEPPEPGCTVGRIGIVPTWNDGENWGLEHCQTWFIKVDGSGFDGNLLLRAVVGNCPDEAAPISDVWQRHVEKTLAYLIHKIDQHDKCLNWL